MFGIFKKQTSQPAKLTKVQLAGAHIVRAAELAVHAFQHEPHLQWDGAQRWVFYCAAIPALALVIKFEMFGEMSVTPTATQDAFFKSIEDKLFEIYRQDHDDSCGTVRQCLPLAAE